MSAPYSTGELKSRAEVKKLDIIFRAVNCLHARIEKVVAFAMFGRTKSGRLPAAKRQRSIHAGGRRIEFQDAGFCFIQKSLPQSRRIAEERSRQTVAHAVAQRQRV